MSGAVPLVPHMRPWPAQRQRYLYAYVSCLVTFFSEALLSTNVRTRRTLVMIAGISVEFLTHGLSNVKRKYQSIDCDEGSILVGCDAASLDNPFPKFRRNILSSSS